MARAQALAQADDLVSHDAQQHPITGIGGIRRVLRSVKLSE
jgi:hypothetical protein